MIQTSFGLIFAPGSGGSGGGGDFGPGFQAGSWLSSPLSEVTEPVPFELAM